MMKGLIPNFLNPDREEYESSKVLKSGPFHIYDKHRVYFKSCLVLEEIGSERVLVWIPWVSMDYKVFIEFAKNIDDYEGVFKARLYNDLGFYSNTKDMDVLVDFKQMNEDSNPYLFIPEDSDCKELAKDFKNGMSKQSYDSIFNKINGL